MRAKLPKTSTAQAKPSNLALPPHKDLLLKPSFAGIPIDEISLPPGYPADKATFIQPDTGEAVTLDVIDVEAAAEEPEAALAHADTESVHRFLVRLGEFDDEEGLALPFPLAAPGLIDYQKRAIRLRLPKELGARFLIQYAQDGDAWEELATTNAGVFVDKDPTRAQDRAGYYLISVLETSKSQTGGLR